MNITQRGFVLPLAIILIVIALGAAYIITKPKIASAPSETASTTSATATQMSREERLSKAVSILSSTGIDVADEFGSAYLLVPSDRYQLIGMPGYYHSVTAYVVDTQNGTTTDMFSLSDLTGYDDRIIYLERCVEGTQTSECLKMYKYGTAKAVMLTGSYLPMNQTYVSGPDCAAPASSFSPKVIATSSENFTIAVFAKVDDPECHNTPFTQLETKTFSLGQ